MKWFKYFLLFISFTVFLTAVGIQVYVAVQPEPDRIINDQLAALVPAEVEGWRVIEKDATDSPEMDSRAADILQYTDDMQRDYLKGGIRVSVYIGYWEPGKMPYNLIGSHTPDTCWVLAGFSREDRAHKVTQSVDGRELLPYEWGIYSKNGIEQEVIFWHVIGNEVYNYDPNYVGWGNTLKDKLERGLVFLKDYERYGLSPQRDQVFIRISSNIPFSELWDDEDFQRLILSFEGLGIFRNS